MLKLGVCETLRLGLDSFLKNELHFRTSKQNTLPYQFHFLLAGLHHGAA